MKTICANYLRVLQRASNLKPLLMNSNQSTPSSPISTLKTFTNDGRTLSKKKAQSSVFLISVRCCTFWSMSLITYMQLIASANYLFTNTCHLCKLPQKLSYVFLAWSVSKREPSHSFIFSFQYGDTPLHTGARYGHAGVIRILVSADCNASEQNKVINFVST